MSTPVPPASPAATRSKPRILCVDDEPQVLDGLILNLRRRFDVSTAPSGAQGLSTLESATEGFAVVISDMRMPQMNGAVFLSQVRQRWPDTVRMLLTGQSEIEAAIMAVNEGQIFRFLSKPCPAEQLIIAVDAAVEQHRLITAERVLLEQTLHGSIRALTEILSLQNPLAFGRATRAKVHVAGLAVHLSLKERWPVEVAAMLSAIGAVILPAETVEKLYENRPLSLPEQVMVKRVPAVTEQLLANIPRLEPVREILAFLEMRFDGEGGARKGAALPLGARMLRIALDYDALETQGIESNAALETLRSRKGQYDPDLVTAFGVMLGAQQQQAVVRELKLALIRPGMVFMEDVRTSSGALLIARGHEITASLIERIRNFSKNDGIPEPLRVLVPPHLLGRAD
jgi:response regulator RpfG family c-di-GMP phosphodiesterase